MKTELKLRNLRNEDEKGIIVHLIKSDVNLTKENKEFLIKRFSLFYKIFGKNSILEKFLDSYNIKTNIADKDVSLNLTKDLVLINRKEIERRNREFMEKISIKPDNVLGSIFSLSDIFYKNIISLEKNVYYDLKQFSKDFDVYLHLDLELDAEYLDGKLDLVNLDFSDFSNMLKTLKLNYSLDIDLEYLDINLEYFLILYFYSITPLINSSFFKLDENLHLSLYIKL